ncbi:hypothetical protein [Roseateles depolymerans]|uniref:hypothetical protein n=1 Tax=Roseateles depolymerans TaxID=76731 RepID=UPI0011C07909|nr:hypothetical protein [Roseateles depolymerans]
MLVISRRYAPGTHTKWVIKGGNRKSGRRSGQVTGDWQQEMTRGTYEKWSCRSYMSGMRHQTPSVSHAMCDYRFPEWDRCHDNFSASADFCS